MVLKCIAINGNDSVIQDVASGEKITIINRHYQPSPLDRITTRQVHTENGFIEVRCIYLAGHDFVIGHGDNARVMCKVIDLDETWNNKSCIKDSVWLPAPESF